MSDSPWLMVCIVGFAGMTFSLWLVEVPVHLPFQCFGWENLERSADWPIRVCLGLPTPFCVFLRSALLPVLLDDTILGTTIGWMTSGVSFTSFAFSISLPHMSQTQASADCLLFGFPRERSVLLVCHVCLCHSHTYMTYIEYCFSCGISKYTISKNAFDAKIGQGIFEILVWKTWKSQGIFVSRSPVNPE